ncbi:M20 family metallopeptidase [Desulfovibrio sp. JC022]|uniref:M20 metallopeptidase family protein n=1 Tax=Desulfovibrio sp. JC022 TaxID=2593642 RepID=UPI0013D780D6|nr:amidohydrolase [Desulfovibrio sp. JC022]NDV24638.1 amidohydrolase [Desulfovibrio sp. JC022]
MDLNKLVQAELDDLVGIYKHLHANPELSHQEEKSSKLIADQLEACGISVTRNFGGYGVVGVLENGDGPTVMVRGDMDALPIIEETGLDYASAVIAIDNYGNETGVMHACGHDIHMTTLIGTARMLFKSKNNWQGKILFVGQPAEEVGGGARAMIKQGLFEQFGYPDYCLATHVIPQIEAGNIMVKPGPIMAGTSQLKITLRGVGGHGAIPHECKDPVVLAARIVTSLQAIVSRELSPLTPGVVTVGSIHGGTRANIIPSEVVMEVTFRFADSETHDHILKSIKRICKYEALSMGIPEELLPIVEFDDDSHLPATTNDSGLTEIIRKAASELLGEDKVHDAEMVMVSEDFSLFRSAGGKEIPSCMFFTGATSAKEMALFHENGINPPSIHNSKFYPPPEPTIRTAVTTMAGSVLKLLS